LRPKLLIQLFHNITTTTVNYTLSLHDALPIYKVRERMAVDLNHFFGLYGRFEKRITDCYILTALPDLEKSYSKGGDRKENLFDRSEEHTSELQSRENLVCRLLLEKKKKTEKYKDAKVFNGHNMKCDVTHEVQIVKDESVSREIRRLLLVRYRRCTLQTEVKLEIEL